MANILASLTLFLVERVWMKQHDLQRQTDDTWLDLCSLQDFVESASQSCYALLNRHILYGLMNDRCFIHGGEIVYILWSTFQVLWRLQRMGAEGLKRKEDWLNSLVSAIPAFRWKGDSDSLLMFESSSEQTHPQQIMSRLWNTSVTVLSFTCTQKEEVWI